MSARDQVRGRSLRLLDYLAALAAERRGAPRRQLAEYVPAPLLPADVPSHPGVRLGPTTQRESWLEVARVPQPAAPSWPPPLDRYLAGTVVSPDAPPTIPAHLLDAEAVEQTGEREPPGVPGEERDAPPGAVALLDAWVRQVWRPWAPEARAARDARALYQRLFDLRLRLQREAATVELAWGHSVLCWRVGDATIIHPLLVTRMVLTVDPDSGVIRLHPDGPVSLETEPLHGLGLPGLDEMSALRDRLRTAPADPWDAPAQAELHRQILAPLGLDARATTGPVPPPGPSPVLVDTWAVYVRPRPALQAQFYAELRTALAERDLLPEAIAAVVADDRLVAAALGGDDRADGTLPEGAHADRGRGRRGHDGSPAGLGERLLMPLPTNADQERIARQLAGARGVTVQGPPGTGKSHTIANMICHLVAHGQRVLVTAQDEQALAVLRDKIPRELRDLTVAVLGSSRADLDELRAAIVEISGAVSEVDPARETAAVKALAEELDAARATARALELRMIDLLAGEAREFELPHGRERAPEVASWLAERAEELGFVPDRLDPTRALPLGPAELAELYRTAREITPADARAAAGNLPGDLPDGASLPGAVALGRLHDELDEIRAGLADLEQAGLSVDALDALDVDGADGADGVRALVEDTRAAADRLRRLSVGWLTTARAQCAASGEQARFWADQATALAAEVAELRRLTTLTFGRSIELPAGDPRVQLRLLADLRGRFAAGRGIPRLGGRELRDLHDAVRVDGLAARTGEDVAIVEAEVRRRQTLAAAAARQAAIAAALGGEAIEPAAPDVLTRLDAVAGGLADAVDWERRAAPELSARLRAVFPAGHPAGHPTGHPVTTTPSDPDTLSHLAGLLATATGRRREKEIAGALAEVERALAEGGRSPRAGRVWADLHEALTRRDLATWTALLDESARLAALRPGVERRDRLAARLRAVAPLWTDAILTGQGDPSSCGEAVRASEAWRWRQAQTWLDDLHSDGDLTTLGRQLADASRHVRALVLETARRSARLGLAIRLGDSQRRALTGWVQALDRIGKGTGKYAPRWRAEARAHMRAAMGAVPVWIMPTHRVMESFDPGADDLFDVVIVDESSQCDLLALGVLSLARKAVVVGDDAQTSPEAVGIERAKVHALIDAHLPDVAQRSLLDVEASLYDTAARVFPRTIVLKEHFRCLPDIIGFSNRFYDQQILPLREDPELALGAPLRPVRVPRGARSQTRFGDANPAEAQALVERVLACCADPAYDGMSMGVVTLLGAGQPRLIEHTLVERLGEREFSRRDLRVGDPYQFQGDERDVIFISVVADDNRSAATRRRDQQRVNVAASRARNQMWVFHSVDPATLRDDDVRRQLIEYMYAGQTGRLDADLANRCESEFERAVLRELLARGYRVRPQHPVGRYRIDLVVEGVATTRATAEQAVTEGATAGGVGRRGPRLAVECDGDRFHGPDQWEADLRRQRILERLGWTFFRIRGSEFYRHPRPTLEALVRRLDQLGIHPVPVPVPVPVPAPAGSPTEGP
ncbi:DNA helicase [Frankia sp. B2]|uniref:AAA domain-containing protein n=1 Tax=Frankia sp. B2 TaxID=2541730 RepID=UPI00106A08A8|nr:AAA domain-containing protein [Frankia sp. B2]TFE33756.1 DNA helicase [Frankia sp. B2]